MCDLSKYDEEKKTDLNKIEKKISELVSDLIDFNEMYSEDGEDSIRLLIEGLIWRMIGSDLPIKFNHYYYSDYYYDRCGGESGHKTSFISMMKESEIKNKLLKRMLDNPLKKVCPHEFLKSLSHEGILIEGDVEIDGNNFLNYEINIGNDEFNEKYLLPKEEYEKILQKRQDDKKIKDNAAKVAQLKIQEEQDRALYEKLKQKFE